MNTKRSISKFYRDLESLSLRFPVAEIVKKTGFAKGNVSEILSKKKEPSENFLYKFYQSFEIPELSASEKSIRKPKTEDQPHEGIPIYEAPVKAGLEPMYRDEHNHADFYLQIPQFKDCDYGCRASGDSMYPEIRSGALIICKEVKEKRGLIYGDIYVIQTISGLETVKYLHPNNGDPDTLILKSRNANIPDTVIQKEDVMKIFKVRGVFNTL